MGDKDFQDLLCRLVKEFKVYFTVDGIDYFIEMYSDYNICIGIGIKNEATWIAGGIKTKEDLLKACKEIVVKDIIK